VLDYRESNALWSSKLVHASIALRVHVCCIVCTSRVNVKGRSVCMMAFIISEALPVVPAKLVRHILNQNMWI